VTSLIDRVAGVVVTPTAFLTDPTKVVTLGSGTQALSFPVGSINSGLASADISASGLLAPLEGSHAFTLACRFFARDDSTNNDVHGAFTSPFVGYQAVYFERLAPAIPSEVHFIRAAVAPTIYITQNAFPAIGTWHTLAQSFDATGVSFYVDGVADPGNPYAPGVGLVAVVPTLHYIALGNNVGGTGPAMGYLGCSNAWARVLTPAEQATVDAYYIATGWV
jgi:hypothetical protein